MPASLALLDGASKWFRSYFGVPSSITAPDGRPVNAVRGFIDSMAVVITQQKPSRLVVCLDLDWRPNFGSTSSRPIRRTASPKKRPFLLAGLSPTSRKCPMT